MRRSLLPFVLVVLAVFSVACTTQQAAANAGLTGSSSSERGGAANSSRSENAASGSASDPYPSPSASGTAASSSVGRTTSARRSSHVVVSATTTGPTTTGQLSTKSSTPLAEADFLQLARSAYPGRTSAELEQTGHTICAALRKDSSVHDEVGLLSGEINSQQLANQIVVAAIETYCREIKR